MLFAFKYCFELPSHGSLQGVKLSTLQESTQAFNVSTYTRIVIGLELMEVIYNTCPRDNCVQYFPCHHRSSSILKFFQGIKVGSCHKSRSTQGTTRCNLLPPCKVYSRETVYIVQLIILSRHKGEVDIKLLVV